MLFIAIVIRCTVIKGLPVSRNKAVLSDVIDVLTRSVIPGEFKIWISFHGLNASGNQ
jgi:hypothetical protein